MIFETEIYEFQKGLYLSRHINKRDFVRDPCNLIAFKLLFAGCSNVGFLMYQMLYLLIELGIDVMLAKTDRGM